ncbi:MAG: adenosylcobinamide-GDP ribazoletransferase [Candidatus Methanomethylophilaceae archaeon]|nr:adenosylcobinamide-GDP ribazoletransferase [Candidatus Methanomethylophilaceae archaeon]
MTDEKTNRDLGPDAESAPSRGATANDTSNNVKISGETPAGKRTRTNVASRGSVVDALAGMLSFFTIFRLNVGEKHIHAANCNFWLAPVIGFLNGLIVAAVGGIMAFIGASLMMTCAMMLATSFLVSKFLHFDGLVDFGDGMVATGDREKKIRALKDTNIGAGGLGLALTIVLLSFAGMNSFGVLILLLVGPVEVLVKNTMVATATFGDPGNGMASEQVRYTSEASVIMSSVLTVALSFLLLAIAGLVMDAATGSALVSVENAARALLIIAVSVASTLVMGYIIARLANRQFGYVNGDVLGASNEIGRAFLYIVIIAAITALEKTNMWI